MCTVGRSEVLSTGTKNPKGVQVFMVQLPSLQTPILEVAIARIKAPGFNSSFPESEDTHMCISIVSLYCLRPLH